MAETKEIFSGPMVMVSPETGNMYPVWRATSEVLEGLTTDDGEPVVLVTTEGAPAGLDLLYCEPDAVSVSQDRAGKPFIDITNLQGKTYRIRAVKDTDAAWLFRVYGLPLPASGVEKVIQNMGDVIMNDAEQVGNPAVFAFTRDESLEAVAFVLKDVAMYFRVDGTWTTEAPVDLEDTDSVRIEPTKATDFVNRWDSEDEDLGDELPDYSVAEEE